MGTDALDLWGEPADAGRVTPTGAGDIAANAAMERYANGDDGSFSELYDALAPRLYAFLRRQTRNAAHAEDLVQQTLLQMHCARHTYATGADVVPWAFAIARHLCIDAHRRCRHGSELVGDVAEAFDDRPSVEPRPDEALQAKQTARRIEQVLAAMPESHRLAFELLKHDGLSLVAAAEVLGISVAAVKVRAHRTYEALRAALREDGASNRRPMNKQGQQP
ncbi:MAG: sigma-70 family RNA polymerase sigma factor [Polyangiales bacterium]